MQKFGSRTASSLLLTLVGVIAVLVVQTGYSWKPIIHFPREFDPVGTVDHHGRQVTVALVGGETAVPCNPGDIHEYNVVVVQEETGAKAVGFVRVPCGPPSPEFVVDARVVPGSPAFVEGPAAATADAEVRNRGQVIRSWSWTSEVRLVPAE